MRIKSLIKAKNPSLTSEFLWELPTQPEATCPLIDATIEDIHSFLAKQSTLKWQLKEYLGESPEIDKLLRPLVLKLELSYTRHMAFKGKLEELRSLAQELRNIATERKNAIWSLADDCLISDGTLVSIDYSKLIEIPDSKKQVTFSLAKEFAQLLDLGFLSSPQELTGIDEFLFTEVSELIAPSKELSFLSLEELNELKNLLYIEEWSNAIGNLLVEKALLKIQQKLND